MDALLDEVASLEAILMEDVRITRNKQSDLPELIETTIFPVVDDEVEQFVCVTLQVFPTAHYPDENPKFKLIKPRGLDDLRLEQIRAACVRKLEELQGNAVVFDLIAAVRELLTGSNLPSGQCVVCLYGFTEGDEFTRTDCFHFLHSYCLGRHLNAMRRNHQEEFDKLPTWLQLKAEPFSALCPVCREVIKDDGDSLKCAMPPAELQNAPTFQLTDELRELQQRMAALYLQQKERGGIIDVEAEKAVVISIETEHEMRRRHRQRNTAAVENTAEKSVFDCDFVDGGQISSRDNETKHEVFDYAAMKPSGSRNSSTTVPPLQAKAVALNSTASETEHSESNKNDDAQQPVNIHKRYPRGGRRHHYHQHHHRESRVERERERFEYKHGSMQALKTENTNSNAKPLGNNKQTKGGVVGMTQNR